MMLHTYNPQPMSLPSIKFLHCMISEIQPGQDFTGQGHYDKVKGQIKVMPRHCTPIPPNQCPYQVSTSYTLQFLRYSTNKLFPLPPCPPIRTPWVKTIPQQPSRWPPQALISTFSNNFWWPSTAKGIIGSSAGIVYRY